MLGDLDHSEHSRDFGYCRGIMFEEAIRRMRRRRRRATKPDRISVEFWKSADNAEMEWLTKINIMFRTSKMPKE